MWRRRCLWRDGVGSREWGDRGSVLNLMNASASLASLRREEPDTEKPESNELLPQAMTSWARLFRNRLCRAGFLLAGLLLLAAVIAPLGVRWGVLPEPTNQSAQGLD